MNCDQREDRIRIVVTFVSLLLLAGSATAQQPDPRLEELQQEIAELHAALAAASRPADRLEELERRLQVLAEEVERPRLGGVAQAPAAAQGRWGLAPAASKVYAAPPGVSLGGYGEMVYENPSSRRENGSPSTRAAQVDFSAV